ncbi:serine hydrolase domain-containing protein [Embleya sp. AB8]|uniref:serine hydrolase domain-containing protein n=1 Tax=Embleya sp. AB8 TaxID=3156304 RepID=UPI003C73EDD9
MRPVFFPPRLAALAAVAGLVLTAAAAAPASAAADTESSRPTPGQARWQQDLDAATRDAHAVSIVAQVRDGRNRKPWTGSSGVRELGKKAPVPVDGRFRIGSVTKMFTSTVVLQLVGEGRLGLDDPIERHLPGLIPNSTGITVRTLLNQRSGLPEYGLAVMPNTNTDAGLREWNTTARWRTFTPRELVTAAVGDGTAAHPGLPRRNAPGAGFYYSNTNYVLAGMLITKLTGEDFRTQIERRIVRPLGLEHTTFPGASKTIPGRHAHDYARIDGTDVDISVQSSSWANAAGEAISTTEDLDRFGRALFGGNLLRPAERRELTAPATSTNGSVYGLGVFSQTLSCGVQVWGHDGDVYGHNTQFFTSGDRTLTVSTALRESPALLDGQTAAAEKVIDDVFCAPPTK